MRTAINRTTYNASPVLPQSAGSAVLISKGSTVSTSARIGLILQNQPINAGNIYVSNTPNKQQMECLQLQPAGVLLRDIFAPTDDIYAFADAANCVLTFIEQFSN